MVSPKIIHLEVAMPRLMLSDSSWNKLSNRLLNTNRVYAKPDHRMTMEGILYRMRVGCPWRDLPSEFGDWNRIYRRFNSWSEKGILLEVFESLRQDPDMEWQFIDGSIVKAHQHSAGAASNQNEAIGKSRGGNTTKIHLSVDSYGLPVMFEVTGGHVHDCKVAPEFIERLPRSDYIIADKGYDSEAVRDQVRAKQATPIIPRKGNSKIGNEDIDWSLYKYRHLVENAFARLKHYRAIASRYDKLLRNYVSTVALGCCMMWLPM